MVPELERGCGSWVVVDRKTGKPVYETYSRGVAEKINQDRYEVITAMQWLQRLNRLIKEGKRIT